MNNAAGFGFSGVDKNGNFCWDLLSNLNIWKIEVSLLCFCIKLPSQIEQMICFECGVPGSSSSECPRDQGILSRAAPWTFFFFFFFKITYFLDSLHGSRNDV